MLTVADMDGYRAAGPLQSEVITVKRLCSHNRTAWYNFPTQCVYIHTYYVQNHRQILYKRITISYTEYNKENVVAYNVVIFQAALYIVVYNARTYPWCIFITICITQLSRHDLDTLYVSS